MSEDDLAARQALAAEAARLKQAREDEAKATQTRAAQDAADAARDRNAISRGRMRTSLSHIAVLGIGLFLLAGAAFFFFSTGVNDQSEPIAGTRYTLGAPGWALLVVGLCVVAFHLTAVARAERWRARLPFRLEGFELLGLGQAVTSAELRVDFRDTRADLQVVTELVRARLPQTSEVRFQGGVLAVVATDLDRVSTNRELAAWLREAVDRVLLDVHRGYPIGTVTLVALKTGEFDVSSGD